MRCENISVRRFSYGIIEVSLTRKTLSTGYAQTLTKSWGFRVTIEATELGAPLEEADRAHLWSSRYQVHEPDIRGVIYNGGWSGSCPFLFDRNIVKLITYYKSKMARIKIVKKFTSVPRTENTRNRYQQKGVVDSQNRTGVLRKKQYVVGNGATSS